MSARDRLLGWLDEERGRQVEFLQAFTRIDTCNPPGDTRQAADVFRRFLDTEGLPHRTEAPQAAMPNLISSFAGARPGRHLVLNGHLDVFPIGDRSAWKRDPLSGDIVDGRVYGRGTVDMKCGTTALLFVHAYLHRLKDELAGKVTLTVVSDEETGGKWGADWLVRECADEVLGDCVLNTEPSGVHTVRFGEKSMLWMRFVIKVPGGHSAYPHTSPSATKIAASLIKDLEGIEAMAPAEPATVKATLDRAEVKIAANRSLGEGGADVMRRVSVNIGTIQGA
jgi:succinyl-diaminopimelate desuccinylase